MRREPPGPGRPPEDGSSKAWIVSAIAHAVLVGALLGYGLFKPQAPVTAVIELVAGSEATALRPSAPPAPEPPAEPTPEPPPEAEEPTVAPTPKDTKTPPKPEPKKPARDTVAKATKPGPAAPAAPPAGSAQGSEGGIEISGASGSPSGKSRWAGRVRQMIHKEWRPPSGIDVELPDTVVVRFKVEVETGEISDIALAKGSASSLLNDESLRAVKRRDRVVAPKSVVPEATEDYWQVRYEFVYKGY